MKKYFFVILLMLVFIGGCVFYVPYSGEKQPPPETPQTEPIGETPREELAPALDISYFYGYLSPYGPWVYYPPYGYVWVPQDAWYGWRPYTYGQWVWTDYGWTWVSYFKWGWAPFHYGRWAWDTDLGWFWVPDTVWGPGWVTWRRGNLYIGWAPLPPEARFVAGIGIRDFRYSIPYSHWVFVDGIYFLEPQLNRYIFPFERNVTFINSTVIQTNIYVQNNRVINAGIDLDQVRRITRRSISKVELRDAKREGASRVEYGNLEIYRPTIRESGGAKPKTILNKEEARAAVSKAQLRRPGEKEAAVPEERSLIEIHKREIRLLQESQQKEVQELEKKMEEQKRAAKTSEEKAKIDNDYKQKVMKLRKTHEEEKSQVEKRHEEETAKEKGKEAEKKEAEKGKIKKKKEK
jgi:hypothetical protein